MFRRAELCPGAGECPYVLMESTQGGNAEPCEECPVSRLDAYLESPKGGVVGAAIDLDFALQAGVAISRSEITYAEFLWLRLLTEERNRYHEEQMRKSSERPAFQRRRG
jgi:hypothetical protein